MNKYKFEIEVAQMYIIDVLAKDEDEAQELANKEWDKIEDYCTKHHYESGDPTTTTGSIYDVTDTDDPFNPIND